MGQNTSLTRLTSSAQTRSLYGNEKHSPTLSEAIRMKALKILYTNLLKYGWRLVPNMEVNDNIYKLLIYPDEPNRNYDVFAVPIFLSPPVK